MKLDQLIEEAQEVLTAHGDLEVRAYYWDDRLNIEIEAYLHMLSLDSNDKTRGTLTLEMEETSESIKNRTLLKD